MHQTLPPVVLLVTGTSDDLYDYSFPDISATLAEETRNVAELFENASHGRISVRPCSGASKEELSGVFANYRDRVSIFHFAGHAYGNSLLLREEKGYSPELYAKDLALFLQQYSSLRLVFLNACTTEEHQLALKNTEIPAIVATTDKINDEAAKTFAVHFYKRLVGGYTIHEAFQDATLMVGDTCGLRENPPWYLHTRSSEVKNWTLWTDICRLQPTDDASLAGMIQAELNQSMGTARIMPMPIPLPPSDRTRSGEVAQIAQTVVQRQHPGVVLYGELNIGKTVLARRVLHDSLLSEGESAFPIRFEVSVQRDDKNVAALLRRLLTQCTYGSGERVDADRIPDRELGNVFRRAFSEKQCIVFFRNVEPGQVEPIAALHRELPTLTILATTLKFEAALQLHHSLGYEYFEVLPLDEKDSLELLTGSMKHRRDGQVIAKDGERRQFAGELVRLLAGRPALLRRAAYTLKLDSSFDPAALEEELEQICSSLAKHTLSTNDRDLVASAVAQLTPHEQEEFCRLSAFAPWPASFRASTDQVALFVPLEALKETHRGWYQISPEFYSYAEELAGTLFSEDRRIKMRDGHAKQFAQAAHAVYLGGVEGAYDYEALHRDWPNIDHGWRWAMERQEQDPSPKMQNILVKYASCLVFFDPLVHRPQEKIKRIEAALPGSALNLSQLANSHLWISLAQAYLDLAYRSRNRGNDATALRNVQQAEDLLRAITPSLGNDTIEFCVSSIIWGDIHLIKAHDDAAYEDEAKRCYMVGQSLAHRFGLRRHECLAVYGIAQLKVDEARLREAIGGLLSANRLAVAIYDSKLQVKILEQLAGTIELLLQEMASLDREDKDASRLRELAASSRQLGIQLSYASAWR